MARNMVVAREVRVLLLRCRQHLLTILLSYSLLCLCVDLLRFSLLLCSINSCVDHPATLLLPSPSVLLLCVQLV